VIGEKHVIGLIILINFITWSSLWRHVRSLLSNHLQTIPTSYCKLAFRSALSNQQSIYRTKSLPFFLSFSL